MTRTCATCKKKPPRSKTVILFPSCLRLPAAADYDLGIDALPNVPPRALLSPLPVVRFRPALQFQRGSNGHAFGSQTPRSRLEQRRNPALLAPSDHARGGH